MAIYEGISEGITAAGFVAVRLPIGQICKSFSLWTADGAAWIYSHNSDGDTPILVTSDGTKGFPLSLEIMHGRSDALGNILCYAKGTSSTTLVGLITHP